MIRRSIISTLLLATANLGTVASTSAATMVEAGQYGLQVTHSELARIELEQGKQGIELQVTLSNQGSHDLYDIRLFLERAGSHAMLKSGEPARVQFLSAGSQAALTWTFELSRPLVGPLRDVTFQIEAVDSATQQIVRFNQKSGEAR